MSKPYKARTLNGAQRMVRWLQRQRGEDAELIKRLDEQNKLLAMLAADGPCFTEPTLVWKANGIRDRTLAKLGLAPDGKLLKPESEPTHEQHD